MSLKTDLAAWIAEQKTRQLTPATYWLGNEHFDALVGLVKANSAAARRRRAKAKRDKTKADLTKTD